MNSQHSEDLAHPQNHRHSFDASIIDSSAYKKNLEDAYSLPNSPENGGRSAFITLPPCSSLVHTGQKSSRTTPAPPPAPTENKAKYPAQPQGVPQGVSQGAPQNYELQVSQQNKSPLQYPQQTIPLAAYPQFQNQQMYPPNQQYHATGLPSYPPIVFGQVSPPQAAPMIDPRQGPNQPYIQIYPQPQTQMPMQSQPIVFPNNNNVKFPQDGYDPHQFPNYNILMNDGVVDYLQPPSRSAIQKNLNLASRLRKQCPVCGKICSRPSTLKTHYLIHTGDTPFRCPWKSCNKSFNVKSNMLRHLKSHQKKGAKTYVINERKPT